MDPYSSDFQHGQIFQIIFLHNKSNFNNNSGIGGETKCILNFILFYSEIIIVIYIYIYGS